MPSDETLEAADQFHGNLVAALEWSTMEPIRGLTLLTRLARVWNETGRAGDAMFAVIACSPTRTPSATDRLADGGDRQLLWLVLHGPGIA